MSTLSSTSTLAEVQAAYDDNASWQEDSSVAKAKAFATACRMLLRRLATEQAVGQERIRLDENLRQLRAELSHVTDWISVNATSSSPAVTLLSFEELR